MNHPPALTHSVCIMTSAHPALDVRIFHKQARTLAAHGFDVTLLAPIESRVERDGVQIVPVGASRSRMARLQNIVRVTLKAIHSSFDIYHFHDPELIPTGLLIQAIRKRPVIYDVHEYYADSIRERPWIPRPIRNIVANLFQGLEHFAVRRLAAVVVVNDHMNEQFATLNPEVTTVCNFPHKDFAEPYPPCEHDGPLRIAYVGSITPSRGLDVMVLTMEHLRKLGRSAELLLIGRIDWAGSKIEVSARDARLLDANIRCLGAQPYDEVVSLIKDVDVLWCPLQRTGNYEKAIPTKLLEYMALAKPIVATEIGQTHHILTAAGCGISVTPDDITEHAEAIIRLQDDPDLCRKLGEQGRKAFVDQYSWESQGDRLVNLYHRLLDSSSGTDEQDSSRKVDTSVGPR